MWDEDKVEDNETSTEDGENEETHSSDWGDTETTEPEED